MTEPKHHLTPVRILAASIVVMVVLALVAMALFPLRNGKPEAVAERFLRNSREIGTEAGGMIQVGMLEERSRSQEIARRLRSGESLSDNRSVDAGPSQFTQLTAGIERLRMNVTGDRRRVEAEVSLQKNIYGDFDVPYYVVAGVKYRTENGEWVNVPIGWSDNYFLLFK